MGEHLSVFEVLDVAQTMEQNGADFYKQAAGLRIKPEEKEFLLGLARMEEDHKKAFLAMQRAIKARPAAPVSDNEMFADMSLYLKVLSDSQNLEGSRFGLAALSVDAPLSQAVLIGIDLEKETILYYLGMRDLFADAKDRKVIDKIIAEEKEHLTTLVKEYRKLDKGVK